MTMGDWILVGDIGGTNVRFALARESHGRLVVSDVWKRAGADYATFDLAVAAYRETVDVRLTGASFGFAGVVTDGRAELLHRDWTIDRRDVAQALGVSRCVLVNDFFAMARSAPDLTDGVIDIVDAPADPEGAIAVSGPGTGFGVGVLRRVRDGWVVVSGEGGHQSYGPQTGLEFAVAQRLREAEGYVSNEVVASGSGFNATLKALAETMGLAPRFMSPADVMAAADAGDALALEMCRLRARTVMTAVGNTALSVNATGGVFIAGGVSVKLERYLREPEALARFFERGPRASLMRAMPLRLITSEEAPLIGAGRLWLDEEARGWL
jgi:glucokinase